MERHHLNLTSTKDWDIVLLSYSIEHIIRASDIYHSHKILAKADDISVVTRTVKNGKLQIAKVSVGPTANETKTKYMQLKEGSQQNGMDLIVKVQDPK